DAANTRAEGEADHRRRSPPRPQAELGEAERSRVVDQERRQPQGRPDRARDWLPGPRPGDVDEEPRGAGGRIVEPRHADPDRGHPGMARDRLEAHRRKAPDDGVRAVRGRRRDLVTAEHRPTGTVLLRDHPLDVRAAEVETEMAAHGWTVAGVHHA